MEKFLFSIQKFENKVKQKIIINKLNIFISLLKIFLNSSMEQNKLLLKLLVIKINNIQTFNK